MLHFYDKAQRSNGADIDRKHLNRMKHYDGEENDILYDQAINPTTTPCSF